MHGRVFKLAVLISVCLLSACDVDSEGRRESHPEKTLLKDYVNEPRDKANAAAARVEDRQAEIERELESIGAEDDDADSD